MAERLNATVLKTVVPQGIGGSNPSFSAKSPAFYAGLFFYTLPPPTFNAYNFSTTPDNNNYFKLGDNYFVVALKSELHFPLLI